MPEHSLTDKPSSKAISPKVSVPFILGVLAVAIEAAATQSWDEVSWLGSVMVVLYAVTGYLVNDPARQTEG